MAAPLCCWHSHCLTLCLLPQRMGNKPNIQPCHQKLHLFHSNQQAGGEKGMENAGWALMERAVIQITATPVLPGLFQSLLTSKGALLAGSEQVWDHSLPTPAISKCNNGWTSSTITQLPVQQVGSCELHPSSIQPHQLTKGHAEIYTYCF